MGHVIRFKYGIHKFKKKSIRTMKKWKNKKDFKCFPELFIKKKKIKKI